MGKLTSVPAGGHAAYRLIGAVGLLVFLLGAAVYLLDRPAGSAYLLPRSWTLFRGEHPVFGAIGNALPSLAHAFSFSLFTSLLFPGNRRAATLACIFWGSVNVLFELGQHPAVAPWLVRVIGDRFDGIFILDHLAAYFRFGTFDGHDVAASVIGAGVAWLALILAYRRTAPRPMHPMERGTLP